MTDEPTSGKVTMASVMTYVAEQFDKLRIEMCDGFDKLAQSLAETRKDFATHHELDAALLAVRAEIKNCSDANSQLRSDLTAVQGQVGDIIKLVYKAVGIGVVVGIVFGAFVSAIVPRIIP